MSPAEVIPRGTFFGSDNFNRSGRGSEPTLIILVTHQVNHLYLQSIVAGPKKCTKKEVIRDRGSLDYFF